MRQLIHFEWAIKYLLHTPDKFIVFEGFLSALLREEIQVVRLLECNQQAETTASNRIDLLVATGKGDLLVVALQTEFDPDFLQSLLIDTSTLISSLHKDSSYRHIKRIIAICLLYGTYNLGRGTDYLYQSRTSFTGIHDQECLVSVPNHQDLTDATKIRTGVTEYYLIRINKFTNQIHDPLDEWIYLFKNCDVPEKFSAKHIHAAAKMLQEGTLTRQQYAAYDRAMQDMHYRASMERSRLLDALDRGIESAKSQGIEPTGHEIAHYGLRLDLDLETIARASKLSMKEVEAIQQAVSKRENL